MKGFIGLVVSVGQPETGSGLRGYHLVIVLLPEHWNPLCVDSNLERWMSLEELIADEKAHDSAPQNSNMSRLVLGEVLAG